MTFIKKQWTRFKEWLIIKLGGRLEKDVKFRVWRCIPTKLRVSVRVPNYAIRDLSKDEVVKMLAREFAASPEFQKAIRIKTREDPAFLDWVVDGTIALACDDWGEEWEIPVGPKGE